MVALGIEQEDLEEMLSRHFNTSVAIRSWSLEQDDTAFGGLAGEKNLVQVETAELGILRILLKRVERKYAHEAEVYQTLQALKAPIATFYGHCDLANDRRTMAVEYLPVTVEWPIPPDYHLAWVEAAAELAGLPVAATGVLHKKKWAPRLQEFVADVEYALSIDEAPLQEAYRQSDLLDLPDLCRQLLPQVLARADALPLAFCHGDAHSPHTGRRDPQGAVLFFDLTTGSIGPRFLDLVSAIIDHGEPYEIEVEQFERRFLEKYKQGAQQDLSWTDFRAEVQLCRALVALEDMRVGVDWIASWLRQTERERGPVGNDPRKWPLLHLQALRQYLLF
jgi:hypothetical protein